MIDLVAFASSMSEGNVDVRMEIGAIGRAIYSPCERYRYLLTRPVASLTARGTVLFVMLNPSTATAEVDDPTIRRCRRFAAAWDFRDLMIANAFAWRSTDPEALYQLAEADAIGPLNDAAITAAARAADLVVCAWGNHGELYERGAAVLRAIAIADKVPHALKVTKIGQPQHPLYLGKTLRPVPFAC